MCLIHLYNFKISKKPDFVSCVEVKYYLYKTHQPKNKDRLFMKWTTDRNKLNFNKISKIMNRL